MKFIHAADLHIDSPLRGLEGYEGAPVQQLRGATREAFANLIRLALREQVGFVILAGDLFDGTWQDMRTGLWTSAQFRKLEQAGIRVFLLRGNHDAASRVRHAVTWPSNVREFSARQPESIELPELGVALHGQGFDHPQVTDDLAASYPDPIPGLFNIGVLHTSLSGSTEHDTYAPTSSDVLVHRGYDYWALGHVHTRSDPPLHNSPFIGYSGNTQGRHIRETGAKGCLLVTVDDGELAGVEFCATDTLRWQRIDITLDRQDGCAELLDRVRREFVTCRQAAAGRLVAVRLIVQGACAAHRDLMSPSRQAEMVAEIRNLANELEEEVWVEKISFDTSAPIDLGRLREGQDMIGQLLRSIEDISASPESLNALSSELQPLADKAGAELDTVGIRLDDPAQMELWLRQAEGLLVARLVEAME